MKTIKPPFAELIDHFKRHDWKFAVDEKRPIIQTGFCGDNGQWRCITFLESEDTQLTFISVLPCNAPAKRRIACAEMLTRINHAMGTGWFSMDFEDGEILLKSTTVVAGRGLTDEIIKSVIGRNLSAMDFYFPALMKVIYAGAKPKDAFDHADQKDEPEETRFRFELN